MKRRTQLAILVAVVLVGLAAWWRLRGRSDDAETDGRAGGGSGSALVHGSGATATRPPAAVPASISGRVTQRTGGAGIAGARVSLARAELGASMFDGGDTPTIHVTTDAQGAWTANAVAPGAYVIAATAKGFVPATRDKLVVGSAQRLTGIDLALDAGGILVTGTVSDFGGGPVAGAEVTVTRERISLLGSAELIAIAGEDGRYELTVADGAYNAVARHADYASETRRFELGGKPATIDFTLTPGGAIRGQVVTRDGTPLPGALVQATHGRGRGRDSSPARADDQGMFKLKGLESGATSLTAAGRGYASAAPTIVELGIGEQVEGVTVIVDRAYTISGTVIERGTTKGVEGIRLGVFSMGSGETAFALSPSAADGTFEILGVRPVSYMMFAFGEDVIPEIGKPVEVVDKDVSGVTVEMAGGVTVSGRVEPPAVATIGIAPTTIGIGNIFEVVKTVMVRAESDETGAFTLRHVPAGTFKLSASTADGQGGKVVVIVETVDKSGVVVKLEQRASLAGRVVDARGTAVAGARVAASPIRDKESMTANVSIDGMRDDSIVTGSDGTFKIVGLDAGKVGLRVHDDGGQLRWADAAHRDKPRDPIVFELATGETRTGITLTVETRDGVIRGNVVGVDRQPASDVWVTATLADDAPKTPGELIMEGGDPGERSRTRPVLTGADGTFVIERLRKGTYELVAETARGTARVARPGIKTGDTVTLVLAPLGTLTGRVTAGNAPVSLYDLSCKGPRTDDDDGEIDRRVTDATGAYKLERLPPAEYTCTAVADAGRATGTVVVPSGEAKLDLALAPFATITGTIVSALSGAPVPGVKVMVSGEGFDAKMLGEMLTGGGPASDARGVFMLARVPPGKGELTVMPKDGGFQQLAKREFVATSGQRLDLGTIKIVPPRTGDAGTLGMGTEITDGALVVASVKPGGPAEGAGVRVGDKIVSIEGVAVADLTPVLAQTLLASGTVGAGQKLQLGLDRAGTVAQITIIAVAW